MRPAAVLTDLDGTLLEHGGVLGAEARAAIARLRGLGVRLALDDFGTGHASLVHVRRFPITKIKIDKSFTSRVHEEKAAYGIVQSIVSLGRGLGLGVVAEGIERPEQAEVLLELGCLYGQGFLYSRPLPFDRTVKVLERRCPLPLSAG